MCDWLFCSVQMELNCLPTIVIPSWTTNSECWLLTPTSMQAETWPRRWEVEVCTPPRRRESRTPVLPLEGPSAAVTSPPQARISPAPAVWSRMSSITMGLDVMSYKQRSKSFYLLIYFILFNTPRQPSDTTPHRPWTTLATGSRWMWPGPELFWPGVVWAQDTYPLRRAWVGKECVQGGEISQK